MNDSIKLRYIIRNIILTSRTMLYALLLSLVFSNSVVANDVQVTVVNSSESKTVWSGWNVKGTLHFKINSENDDFCVTAWWNKLGKNTSNFELCDGQSLDYRVPAYIFARLKVGWPSSKTVVAVSGNATVVNRYELCGRHIQC